MFISKYKILVRYSIVVISFLIIFFVLFNSYFFYKFLKSEERLKMTFWAEAQKTLARADKNADVELPLLIFSKNQSIPVILTKEGKIINAINVDENILQDKKKLNGYLRTLESQNKPIIVEYTKNNYQKLYYGNSKFLNGIKYYPAILILVLILLANLVFMLYRSTRNVVQEKLWSGMAKETAHQIGTPLSSILGWIEILKSDSHPNSIITAEELEKDVVRLQEITDRFSKIGSEPVLEKIDIIRETKQSFDYLESRFSNQIFFYFYAPDYPIMIYLNKTLYSWTIENLIKNAVDAMKGKGKLILKIKESADYVFINISDEGSGILKKNFKKIFEPGFTTKKRGWGLGLSLSKRIVKEYHKGSIRVLYSELGKGTTMQLRFNKI
jgi:two-component system, sporulation sensor kinase D